MVNNYIPEQGDIVTLEFNPQTGHEQKEKRPALVVSNETFNRITKLALVCPITNTLRGYPLHIALDKRTQTTGVVMCEQVKSLDIFARGVMFQEKLPTDILEEIINILYSFFEKERE